MRIRAERVKGTGQWKTREIYYDATYRENIKTGSIYTDVEETVKTATELADHKVALDVGCGLGRHSFYLAQNGFAVKAVEQCKVAAEYVVGKARTEQLPIEVVNGHVLRQRWNCEFGLVVASMILDEFNHVNALWLVRTIQESTLPGGVHAIVVCAHGTRKVQKGAPSHLFTQPELAELYTKEGWAITSQTIAYKTLQNQQCPIIRMITRKPE